MSSYCSSMCSRVCNKRSQYKLCNKSVPTRAELGNKTVPIGHLKALPARDEKRKSPLPYWNNGILGLQGLVLAEADIHSWS